VRGDAVEVRGQDDDRLAVRCVHVEPAVADRLLDDVVAEASQQPRQPRSGLALAPGGRVDVNEFAGEANLGERIKTIRLRHSPPD
jgi:hypothetical protein